MRTSFLLIVAAFLCTRGAHAQTDIFIRGAGKKFPIAIPQLCVEVGDTTANKDVPKTVTRDLDLSGYFEVIDPGGYLETPGKCARPEDVVYSDWSVIGAEGLVRGSVSSEGGQLRVRMYLHDVQKRAVVLGKEYTGEASQINSIAHRFANEIMRFFTGEMGVFGTQISYSSKVGRYKELFVMDMDGTNVRQLTNDRALALSSSWSPDGSKVVFTSYRSRVPDLFLMDVAKRTVTQVTRGAAMELGAHFAPGGALVVSRSTEGSSQIVLMNMDGTVVRSLTPKSSAIDVSPVFSPDFNSVAFCSNRGGGPQIYVMSADGGGVRRVSFVNSNYCTSPAWSPKGDRLAFVCRVEGNFQIFTSDVTGTNPLQLTSFGDNEDPDWAPNGKLLVFATTFGRGFTTNLAIMRDDGSNIRKVTDGRSGDSEPAWGPVVDR